MKVCSRSRLSFKSTARILFGFFLLIPTVLRAQEEGNLGSLYRTQFLGISNRVAKIERDSEVDSDITTSILELSGGTQITLMAPPRWNSIAERLLRSLQSTHSNYIETFGDIPSFNTSLRLMDEETFYLSTGAPSWTNALYFKGQILIPMPNEKSVDFENISRSIRHEYTHAVIHALSGGRCPGWLDEGLAQWSEGDENPALRPALVNYLRKNPPVSLAILQNGFTRLEPRMVPAAYAQSLYATNGLLGTYGMSKVSQYLRSLRGGASKQIAFQSAFKLDEEDFERALGEKLSSWAHGHKEL